MMLIKFIAVIYLTPVFIIPGTAIAVLGAWLGRVYMKAQIAIKREMSNAKAPVLGHFGAAVSGISTCAYVVMYEVFCKFVLTRLFQHPFVHMERRQSSAKSRIGESIGTRGLEDLSTI
jgi:hypothetical protein